MRRLGAVFKGFLFGVSDGVTVFGVFVLFSFWASQAFPIEDVLSLLILLDGSGSLLPAPVEGADILSDPAMAEAMRRSLLAEGVVFSLLIGIPAGLVAVVVRVMSGLLAINVEEAVLRRLSPVLQQEAAKKKNGENA